MLFVKYFTMHKESVKSCLFSNVLLCHWKYYIISYLELAEDDLLHNKSLTCMLKITRISKMVIITKKA